MSSIFIPITIAVIVLLIFVAVLGRKNGRKNALTISEPMQFHKHHTHEEAKEIAEHLPELHIQGEEMVDMKPNPQKDRIEDLVEHHPDKAVGVIRRWLHSNHE
ncbi:hypothetical protein ACFL12_06510 [Pseudomonadota bacterium]